MTITAMGIVKTYWEWKYEKIISIDGCNKG